MRPLIRTFLTIGSKFSRNILRYVSPRVMIFRTNLFFYQRDGTKIKEFERCDFRPMFEYFEEEKAKKKALTSAEKKELKKQKDEMEAKYVTCLLDGRREKVGNFRVEPPGLFRGRGEHPKKGAFKVGFPLGPYAVDLLTRSSYGFIPRISPLT